MLGLKNAQALVGLLTIFLAYFLTISPAGFFRAWVAKKMGDSTAEDQGFLTLDPFTHMSFMGLIWLALFSRPEYFSGLGWGKHVPINPHNIHGRSRWFKLSCAFFSDALAYFVMATIALTLLSIMITNKNIALFQTHDTSFSLVIAQLLFAIVNLNVFLVLLQVVINGVVLIGFSVSHGTLQEASYLYYFMLFAPIMILIFFGAELQRVIMYGITVIECAITHRM